MPRFEGTPSMTHLLNHFDREKPFLKKQIESTPSPAEAVSIIEAYLSQLHRDMSEFYSNHQYRLVGHLLETIRYAVRTLLTVDKTLHWTDSQPPISPDSVFRRMIRLGILIHVVVAGLLLLLLMITTGPISETSLLLTLILVGIDGYLLNTLWKTRASSKRHSGFKTVTTPTPVEVRLNIAQSQSFLNSIADSLAFADKLLMKDASEKPGNVVENEFQILSLFQDLFEAMYFHDGEWALKKISTIRAILKENSILVKEF
ncbi:MAG TPA: hypothetical protein VLP30_03505, partial [Desulfatirhabdiaceae bacterium]|nr:hypothetical protein [Desulfatirhabdiaceae bacterium]